MTDSSDAIINQVERNLNEAIEADLAITYDQEVKVLSYLVAAEVMLPDGSVEMQWTGTDNTPEYRVWGMLEWLRRRFAETTEII